MKELSWFNKFVFFVNSIFAIFMIAGYLLPFIPPKVFPLLSVLTLVLPLLVIANLIFFAYWLIQFKRQMWLSGILVVIGFFQNSTLYKFFGKEESSADSFTIMSYNVRGFNNKLDLEGNLLDSIKGFVAQENPDILCVQEYLKKATFGEDQFKYSFKNEKNPGRIYAGQTIFSKFEIVKSGSLEFPDSYNNAIFVDIVKGKDTLRLYNIHMQSLSLTPEFDKLRGEGKKQLWSRLGRVFEQQQEQTTMILLHQENCPYPILVAGDFNNTVYSHAYKKIRGNRQDAFEEAGKGFGRTFTFDFVPLRIDFILPDDTFEVLYFKNYTKHFSDHYPVMARLKNRKRSF